MAVGYRSLAFRAVTSDLEMSGLGMFYLGDTCRELKGVHEDAHGEWEKQDTTVGLKMTVCSSFQPLFLSHP